MYLYNAMKRAFIVPPLYDKSNPDNLMPAVAGVTVESGETVQIDDAHWRAVTDKNQAISALLADRFLIVTDSAAPLNLEKSNPTIAVAPELDSSEDDPQVTRTEKIEKVVEVTPKTDSEPAEATRSGKK